MSDLASLEQDALVLAPGLTVDLRVFPPTHRGQVAALLVGSVVLTPLVPTVFGRVAAVAPVARELSHALGHTKASRGSAAIAFAPLLGSTVMGPVFLTGLVTNFLIIGLLPPAEQARFDWIGWLIAAAPAALVLFLGSATILFALHRRSG